MLDAIERIPRIVRISIALVFVGAVYASPNLREALSYPYQRLRDMVGVHSYKLYLVPPDVQDFVPAQPATGSVEPAVERIYVTGGRRVNPTSVLATQPEAHRNFTAVLPDTRKGR
jgi:hypothetical protein